MKTKHLNFKTKSISLLCAFCMLSSFLWGCSIPFEQSTLIIRDTIIAFDTVVTITLYGTDDQDILQEAMDLCRDYDQKFSRTIPESDVYRINHGNGQAVSVSPETILLIKESLSYSELTKGAVDITIAPVRDLWDFSAQNTDGTAPSLPDDTALSHALAHVDYHCIQYDETAGTVTLTDPEAEIDLGFIAKGYIADAIKEYLISQGIQSAAIDLGGNILTIGTKPDGTPFQIGIKKPFENDAFMDVLSITDQSVVTSGIYERCFQIDDKIYHHILDPETGYPVSNELLSVTIISDSSMEGDALSTSCLLLGLSKARELINSLEGVEAVFITKDYEIIDTRL